MFMKLVSNLFISIESVGMRGKLRRMDRTTKSGFHSVFRERLFRISSTEINLLDLHFIRDHSWDHGKRSKRHGWVRQKINQAWDLHCLLKIEVTKIKKKYHMRMKEWIDSENKRITLKTTNESLLSDEKSTLSWLSHLKPLIFSSQHITSWNVHF